MSDRTWLNRERERGNLESLRKKDARQMKRDDEEPWGGRVKEKGPKREGEVSDREKAKCVWESFGAEVHCGRADSVSGGSEVWINASDWRRAAAVVREQNIRRWGEEGEKRRGDGKGPDAEFWKEGDILTPERQATLKTETARKKTSTEM